MRVLSALFVTLLLSCNGVGCNGTPGSTPTVDWPVLAQCGPSTSEIVATVSRILLDDGPFDQRTLSQRGKDELARLAQQYGPETVACLVDYWQRQWTAPGAASSPERTGGAARADNFLHEIGTKIEHVPQ